jgi:hypothetical protein
MIKKIAILLSLVFSCSDATSNTIQNKNYLTIKECEKQILPTKIDKKMLDKVFSIQQKNNGDCKNIYLNVLKNDNITKITKLSDYEQRISDSYDKKGWHYKILLPTELNITYSNANEKTVTVFEPTKLNREWDLSFFNKYENEFDIEKYFFKSNLHNIKQAFLFYLSDKYDYKYQSFSIYKNATIQKEIDFYNNFPIKNVEFEFKDKIHSYALDSIDLENNSEWRLTFSEKNQNFGFEKYLYLHGDFDHIQDRQEMLVEISNEWHFYIQEIDNDHSVLFKKIRKDGE